jgi:hypothetical protein
MKLNEIKNINNDITLLEESIGDLLKKGKEVTEEFLAKRIAPIISKITSALKRGGDFIINLIKRLFNVVERFRQKHPFLFKIVVLLILMVLTAIFSAAAQAQDPATLNYSANALDTMVGLLDKVDVSMDTMEAQMYLKDLKDGSLSGNYSEGARKVASVVEEMYQNLMKKAQGGDESVMKFLYQSLETGYNTTMSSFGTSIKESSLGSIKLTDLLREISRY